MPVSVRRSTGIFDEHGGPFRNALHNAGVGRPVEAEFHGVPGLDAECCQGPLARGNECVRVLRVPEHILLYMSQDLAIQANGLTGDR